MPSNTSLSDVLEFIHSAKISDIQLMNDAIKERYSAIEHSKARQFRLGDTVSFSSKRRGNLKIEGTVTQIGSKNIIVQESGSSAKFGLVNGKWRVSASLLTLVRPADAS